MSDRYIKIRNWEKFQHKDVWKKSGGHAPWIKAYTRLLHDDDWLGLTQTQRGILLGLWLMYSSTGLSVNETTSRRLLSTNKGESRHFLDNLDALNRAGFIEFESQQSRAPVATREEKSREEKSLETTASQNGHRRGASWVPNLNSYTGCRMVRGEIGTHNVYDVLGQDYPPVDWPYERPTRQEVRAALDAL